MIKWKEKESLWREINAGLWFGMLELLMLVEEKTSEFVKDRGLLCYCVGCFSMKIDDSMWVTHYFISYGSPERWELNHWAALLCEASTICYHSVLLTCPLLFLFSEEKYITIQSYTSQGKDEVSFDKGVTVEVIQKNLEGWWFIRWVFSSDKWEVSRENVSSEDSDIVGRGVITALVSCCSTDPDQIFMFDHLSHLSAHTYCVAYSLGA